MIFKWLTVPFSNRTKNIKVPQLWEVRWQSRHGEFSSDTRPEMEAFTSLEAADEFAQSLRNAFMLVKHTSANRVSVTKAK